MNAGINLDLFLLYVSKILDENCKAYIHVLNLSCFESSNTFDAEHYKHVFDLIRKYPSINFIINIHKYKNIYDLCELFDDDYIANIYNLKNIYMTVDHNRKLYFQINDIDNDKEIKINRYLYFRKITKRIYNFPKYYNIMRLKNKLKNVENSETNIIYYNRTHDKCIITLNKLKRYLNFKYINLRFRSDIFYIVFDNENYYIRVNALYLHMAI